MPSTEGWTTASNAAWKNDLVASAVPSTAMFLHGAAFGQNGTRFVTTQATSTADKFVDGLRHRSDGALRVRTTVPSPLYQKRGLNADQTGVVYINATPDARLFFMNGLAFNADGALVVVEHAP